MTVEEVRDNADRGNARKQICSFLILCISLLSVVSDVFIGLVLITQYYLLGYKLWAFITFSFIFFPSVIMHIQSLKLYLANRNMLPSQWFLHSLLLGIIHRYVSAIIKWARNYKSKSCMDSNLVKADLIILKNLYLFKSFLECAPQLVLQLYFIAIAPVSLPLAGIMAATSAFSIAWALIIHTKIKKSSDCPGFVFLVLWRGGMITARISALVLCAYTCGPWMILFIGSHWLAMTLWITYQKAKLDDKEKKGEFNSALVGIIYCFCYLSIKTGQSRSKAVILTSLLLFQNLIFLTVFLLSFADKSPKLAVLSFVAVTFGSLLGITSFFIYNTCFHPRGPLKCITSTKASLCCRAARTFSGKQTIFPISTKNKRIPENSGSRPENEQLQEVQSPSDSIVIIEETPSPNSKIDEKILEGRVEEPETIYDEPKPNEMKKEMEEAQLSVALKRRAICSSVDLTRFLDEKIGDTESELNKSSRAVDAEETPSEILSTHDYENLCAVNIAREPWGIRSWGVYSDIETYRHDDSVFNERRLDNMTTSSEYSGKIEDKDSLVTAEDDLLHCEIDTNSDKTSVNFVPPFPASMLHTIFEENESPFPCVSHVDDVKEKYNSESALVATIDRICLYTPLRSRSDSIGHEAETPDAHGVPGKEVGIVVSGEERKIKRQLCLENGQKDSVPHVKEKMRSVHKFNIFKERYETNRYQVCGKGNAEGSGVVKPGEWNKENISVESCERGSSEKNGIRKSFNFKEQSSFLIQMLTPSKLGKRTFPISPPKR